MKTLAKAIADAQRAAIALAGCAIIYTPRDGGVPISVRALRMSQNNAAATISGVVFDNNAADFKIAVADLQREPQVGDEIVELRGDQPVSYEVRNSQNTSEQACRYDSVFCTHYRIHAVQKTEGS